MIDLKFHLTNAECQALSVELQECIKEQLTPKMIGESEDPHDSATPAYEALRRLLVEVRRHLQDSRPKEKRGNVRAK